MKRFFIVLAVVSTLGVAAIQAQEMQKGMSLFNVGIGFVPGWGINASYELGVIDTWGPGIFTVGGYVGYANWGATHKLLTGHKDDYRVNAMAFSPRATYRYAINRSFEVYGTVMLGVVHRSYSKYEDNKTRPYYATIVGCRYTFAGNISVFAETGLNEISFLNGGLCFSF